MCMAKRNRQVPSNAPRILLISNEFIAESLRSEEGKSGAEIAGLSRVLQPVCATMNDVLIVIPARMASTRLPGKPLADIAGQPMIVHVLRRAQAAAIGPVVVATDSAEVAAAVDKAGGRAVMTAPDHASGSDRIFEALGKVDSERRAEIVVNVQGDLPTIAPDTIRA